MTSDSRLFLALLALCASLMTTSAKAYVLFGDGYVPQSNDTYVRADAGACCIGEASNFTNVYLAQTFKATGEKPEAILLGLASNIASPFQFRLLFTEVEAGFHPGAILWESKDLVLPAAASGYNEYSFKTSGLKLDIGKQYAWILDTYVTRDGTSDLGAYFANIGNVAPAYFDGVQYFADATGFGRDADFASTWINSGFDASFLITYKTPEPTTAALIAIGLLGLVAASRRRTPARGLHRFPTASWHCFSKAPTFAVP